jgi:hypothetical protein
LNSFSVANLSHLNTGCSPAAYGNFTATAGVDTIQLNQALAYNFTATNTFGSAWLGIWIDFNADLDFTDPGEQVFISTAAFGGATVGTGSFTMPTGLTNGFTRMRAIVRYAGAPTGPCTPGGSFGETHDYTVQILSAPTCLPVTAVNASNILPNSADINWTSTTNNYEVEYGLAGFNQGSGTTVTGILANTTNIAGLLSNTSYDVYVRANCGGGDFSPWVKLTFKTACSFFATPFSENFATTPTGSTTNNTVPTCWTYAETTGHVGGGYVTAFSNPRSIPNQYQFTNSSNITDNLMLVSPLIQGLDSNNKQVTFWMKSNTATYNSSIVVGTVGSIANPIGTFDPIDTVTSGLAFTEFIVEFTTAKGYNGTDQYIAFLYREPNGTFRSAFIDDITVAKIPACQKPLGLNASNVSGTAATLGWSSSNSTFTVEWGPCGFAQGTGNFVNNIAGTSTSISGLSGNTCYDFYVRSNCGVNGNSVWNGPFSFTTAIIPIWTESFTAGYNPTATVPIPARWSEGYGAIANPTVFTSTFSGWSQDGFLNVGTIGATRFTFSSFSSSGRDWMFTPPIDLSNGPWELVWDMGITSSGGTAPATMGTDDTLMIVVSTPFGAQWNKTQVIAKFHSGSGLTNTGSLFTSSLAAYVGQTVRIGFYASNTATGGTSYDLHVDNVGVRVPPSCASPTSSSITGITTSGATVNWTPGTGNLTYNIEWGPCGFTQGTGSTQTGLTGTTTAISGLTSNTCYDVYIQGNCGPTNGGTSPWIGPFSFTTLCLPATLTYQEDFTTWPPQCFNLINNGFDWVHNVAGYAVAPFWNFSTGTATMRTRAVTISQAAWLKFKWAHQFNSFYPDDRLVVRAHVVGSPVWDTLIDLVGPTFNSPGAGPTTPPANASDFIEEAIVLNPAQFLNQDVEVEFIGLTDFGPHVFIDQVVVEPVPSCLAPFALTATALTPTGASLGWSTVAGTGFTVEYGPQGFAPGTGTSVANAANPYAVTGLTPNTFYDFYVTDNCDTTAVGGPFTFKTPCVATLSGTYTVAGAPGPNNFATMAEAINALVGCGISGPVTLNVAAVSDTGSYVLNTIPGASATNTVTINGAGIGQTKVYGNGGDAVFVLNNVGFLTMKNMSIYGGSIPKVIWMRNNTRDIILEDMYLAGDTNTTNFNQAVVTNSNTAGSPTATGGNVKNITLRDLDVRGGYYSIAFMGPSTIAFSNDIDIENVDVSKAYFYAFYVYGLDTVAVKTSRSTDFRSTGGYGIYAGYVQNFDFSSNYLLGNTYPMYIFQSNQSSGSIRSLVSNNMMIGGFYGLYLSAVKRVNFYHNSITGTNSGIYGFAGTTTDNLTFKNNISVGGTGFAFYMSGVNTSIDYNHNIYHTVSGANLAFVNTTNFATLAAWQAGVVGQNVNSLSGLPIFVSPTNLHVLDSLAFDVGDNTVGITVDIDGDARPLAPTTIVDIGADEFIPASCFPPTAVTVTGVTSASITLGWNSSGNDFDIEYGPLGFVQGNGTIVTSTTNSVTVPGLSPATNYHFYVRQDCGTSQSLWVGPFVGTTACVAFAMPFVEDFQSWLPGNTEPLCFNSTGGSNLWDRFDNFGNVVARANFWGIFTGTLVLTSPQITVSSAAELRYKWSHLYSSFYPNDALHILGRTVGSPTWDTLAAWVGPAFNSNDGAGNTTPGSFVWDTVALDPSWIGQNIEIQLFGTSGFGPSAFIDSLSVVAQPSSCASPTALASANIVCNAFDVTFTSGSGTSYAEYGPAGFAPGSGTVVSPATSPLSITGLTPGTNYEVYVYDLCSGDTSLPAGPLAVTTAAGPLPTAAFTWTVTPTLTNATVAFDASASTGGTTYSWNFGNSSTGSGVNANGTYTANGTYNVTLIVSNACGSDTLTQAVTVSGIGVAEAALAASFQAYPNPTRGKVELSFSLMHSNAATIEIMDLSGRVVWVESAEVNGTYRRELDLSAYAAGVYLVRVSSEDGVVARRLVVE